MTNDQVTLWNGDAGDAWVETRDVLDEMFVPFERMIAAAVPLHGTLRVLDVGCGTGSTTRAVAQRLHTPGLCLGVDISAPMVAAALRHPDDERAAFACADAGRHPFAPASFDLIVSRFGIMFFDDPEAAFANLRGAARPGATLHCYAWRAAADNPFMTAADRAVAPLLPPMPPRLPEAPGQFAFARRERIEDILGAAGWQEVRIQPVDVACTFPAAGLRRYASRMGSVGRALSSLAPERRAEILERAVAAFAPFVDGAAVRFDAACWEIEARAPGTRVDAGAGG